MKTSDEAITPAYVSVQGRYMIPSGEVQLVCFFIPTNIDENALVSPKNMFGVDMVAVKNLILHGQTEQ